LKGKLFCRHLIVLVLVVVVAVVVVDGGGGVEAMVDQPVHLSSRTFLYADAEDASGGNDVVGILPANV